VAATLRLLRGAARWTRTELKAPSTKSKAPFKEGIGKVTGNKTKEAAGNIEKNAGKVQHAVFIER
jgi:uncharacterized protein YjbJ (UPF0337 family)